MDFKFSLGQRVRHILYDASHDTYIGIVIERQWIETPGQACARYYIRFIDPKGNIDASPTLLAETELEPVGATP